MKGKVDWQKCVYDLKSIYPSVKGNLEQKIGKIDIGTLHPRISFEHYPPHISIGLSVTSDVRRKDYDRHKMEISSAVEETASAYGLRARQGQYLQKEFKGMKKNVFEAGTPGYVLQPDYSQYETSG